MERIRIYFCLFWATIFSFQALGSIEQLNPYEKIKTFEKNLTGKEVISIDLKEKSFPLFQKRVYSHCSVELTTSSEDGILFKDTYDLTKKRLIIRRKKFFGSFPLSFGIKPIMKRRSHLFFKTNLDREAYRTELKKLLKLCKSRKYRSEIRQRREQERRERRSSRSYRGRIPRPMNQGAGKVRVDEDNYGAVLTGEMSLRERFRSAKNAKKYLYIQSLLFRGDELGKDFARILIQKKREGVDVRVIVDALVANIFDLTPLKTYKKNNKNLYLNLMAAGIRVFGYSCSGKFVRNEFRGFDLGILIKRNHEKIWVADGEFGIIGGINLSNEYFRVSGNKFHNKRDLDMAVKGPVIQDLEEAFMRSWTWKAINYRAYHKDKKCLNPHDPIKEPHLWEEFRRKKSKPYSKYKKKERAAARKGREAHLAVLRGKVDPAYTQGRGQIPRTIFHKLKGVRFVHHRPKEKQVFIFENYLDLIKKAKREIVLAHAYFIPKPALKKALRRASARGVRVKIISNSVEANRGVGPISIVGRSHYYDLAKTPSGERAVPIEIYEWTGLWKGDQHRVQSDLHSKYMVVDKEVGVIGSYNLDGSSDRNGENILIFENKKLAENLAGQFDEDLNYTLRPSLETLRDYKHPKGFAKIRLKLLKIIEDYL